MMYGRSELLVIVIICVTGCADSSAARAKQAALRVLQQDKSLSDHVKASQADSPSSLARLISEYCDKAEQLDCSDCPADFTVSYRQHIRAWREMQVAIEQVPDNVVQGVVTGAINGLFRGELDGGVNRLEGNVARARDRITATWEEVERTGAKYGAAL